MEFNELVRHRYSVRAYHTTPVEPAKLERILAAAILAPTAANRQPFRLLVIRTAGRESELKRIYSQDWFVQAPLVICACGVLDEGWVRRDGKSYCDVDVAIATDHLILAAAHESLGTCWIGAFDAEAARDVLGLPDGVEPIAFTPLGYPSDSPRPKKRKSAQDLVKYDRW